ncbi:MAG: hypothetical protein BGN83_01685 [Rhizobium sp. 63-7]|nr:MAG: hypothetical protein BGN83_01685 [Rhizobium sp. 63-7]
MTVDRLQTLLEEMEQAASEIGIFLAGISKDDFLGDVMRQRAVGMNLVIIGEIATQLADSHPFVLTDHPEIPWIKIRGMRNRIAHGYLSINLDTIWDTGQQAIPDLVDKLHALRHWRAQGE